MEYKFEHTPRRASFEATVAALEFANPTVKGGLPWCRATLAGWSVSDPIHHTVPLLRAPCRLLACHMASAGRSRAAAGMIVQRDLGLRPGEVTSLYPDDISLPEHLATDDGACRAIISLGIRKGHEGENKSKCGRLKSRNHRCFAVVMQLVQAWHYTHGMLVRHV